MIQSAQQLRRMSRFIQHRWHLAGIPLLTTVLIVMGIFMVVPNHDATAICILLLLPITLLAWARGWLAGCLAGVVMGVLVAPYPGAHGSLVMPVLAFKVWIYLSAGYVVLGGLIGAEGAILQRRRRELLAQMGEALEDSQETADRYEALLEDMRTGQERLEHMNKELAILNTIATTVNGSLDISRVQITAIAHIGNLMDVDEVQIFGLNTRGDAFVLQASRPISAAGLTDATPLEIPVHEGLLGRVVISQQPETISEASRDLSQRPLTMSAAVKYVLAVPLRSHSKVFGVLVLGRNSGVAFSQDDERFLESAGRILTVAMENAKLFKQAQDMSLSDELTGLPNRRMFNLRLAAEANCIKATGAPLCMVMFDLDFFKAVNDKYGHPAGDDVLRQFSRRVLEDIRGTDLFCRLGGEEFALVTPDTSLATTTSIAERICRRVANIPFMTSDGVALSMTVSAGVACLGDQEVHSSEDLVAAADSALYAAKANGRNRVEVYSTAMPAPLVPRNVEVAAPEPTEPTAPIPTTH